MRMLTTFLLALGVCLPVCADPGVDALGQRDAWIQEQALMRGKMQMQVHQEGHPIRVFEVDWERTSPDRHRLLFIPDQDPASSFSVLVDDNRSLAMGMEEAVSLPAPWMMGIQAWGEPLEPAMLIAWTLGLPGPDFTHGAPPAGVAFEGDHPSFIEQAGWEVTFGPWRATQQGSLLVPGKLIACRGQTCLVIVNQALAWHKETPEDYKDFSVR